MTPPCRVGRVEAGWAERGPAEGMIYQIREYEHCPQGNGRHYFEGGRAATRFHMWVEWNSFLELTTMSVDFTVFPTGLGVSWGLGLSVIVVLHGPITILTKKLKKVPILKSTWPGNCPTYLSILPCYLLVPPWDSVFQGPPFWPGPGPSTDMLTLDFGVEGHVEQTPAQGGRSCLRSSKEEVQGAVDEVFFVETWSSTALMLESTMIIGLFRWFLVATTQGPSS